MNVAPQIELISPANQTIYSSLDEIVLSAEASDFDGEIESVVFVVNGEDVGEITSMPYELNYTLPAYQTYDIFAVAIDNLGAEVESEHISVKATTPPFVEMEIPGADTTVNGLPEITLKAIADDSYGDVVNVDFYTTNNNLLGSVSTPPYIYTWTVPFYGIFELKAVATDDDGITATSETIILTAELNSLVQLNESDDISVYPNPVCGILTIELGKDLGRDKPLVVLYDINQKVLMQQLIKASSDNKIRIDLQNFAKGTYLLQVKGDTYNYLQKLIVE